MRFLATSLRLPSAQRLLLLPAELWPGEELAEINQRSEKPQKSRFSPGWMGRVGARGTAGDPPASPAMAEEIVYADLDIRSGRCSRKVRSLPQPGSKCIEGFFGGIFTFWLWLCWEAPAPQAGREGPVAVVSDGGSRLLFVIPSVVFS